MSPNPGLLATTGAVSADEFRSAMRCLFTGVTIITTTHETRPWGMTVSAFTSVCAEPPTVLVCLNRKTVLASAVQQAGRFGVNLLSQDQEFLSRLCSRPGTQKYLDDYCAESSATGTPVLRDSLFALDCAVEDARVVGSHLVVMGLVSEVIVDRSRRPLLYGAGSYHQPVELTAHANIGGVLAWS